MLTRRLHDAATETRPAPLALDDAQPGRENAAAGPQLARAGHPRYRVRDGENAFWFWTANCGPRPLVLAGFAAGAAVTRAVVRADLVDLIDLMGWHGAGA